VELETYNKDKNIPTFEKIGVYVARPTWDTRFSWSKV